MNGEPLRPQQGFPLRLMVPGFEGIYQIKYLRRIKVVDRYYMTYDDYGHINPDPKVAALTHQIGPKSVITFPSGGQQAVRPRVLRNQRPGVVRRGRHPRRGDIHRRRPELEECRTSVAGLSHGAYAIWLPLEVGRKRVHADVALHGRTGHGSTDASRGREILERAGGQSPGSRGRQYRSTVESRERRERSQWACLGFSSLRRSSGFARLPGRSRPPTASGETPTRGGNPRLGYRHQPDRKRAPARARDGQRRRGALCAEGVRGMPRGKRRSGGHAPTLISSERRSARLPADALSCSLCERRKHHGGSLALRDDDLGLHQSRHASGERGVAHAQ